MNGSLLWHTAHRKRNPASGWTKSCFAGRNPLFVRTKSAGFACRRKSPQNSRSAGFVYPGSYLLSRDLSSDYHRRADVSLPGSEWDRVGPSGYDHQVSGSFSLLCSLLTSVIICACGLLYCFCWLPCGSRLTSAWLMVFAFSFVSHSHSVTLDSSRIACHRGVCIRSVGC